MFSIFSLFSLGRQEIENLYFYPKIEILQSLGKRYYRLNAYEGINLKELHPKLKLIDVKRIIISNILRSNIDHWKQNFDGHIIQFWYCNGEKNINAFPLLVKHSFIPRKYWKIEKYVTCMRDYDYYINKFEDIINAFLDKNYNSILPDDDQKEFIERRYEFEKNAYNKYLLREETKFQEKIKNTLFNYLDVRPKEDDLQSHKKKGKKKRKFYNQDSLKFWFN